MIRLALVCMTTGTLGLCTAASMAQDEPKPKKRLPRYGYLVDEVTYPQKTPKEAIRSIVRALDRGKTDYVLAHLIDPGHVDYWVERYQAAMKGSAEARLLLAFDRLVRETNGYYQEDPLILKDLRIFAKRADWTETEAGAVGTVETIPARKVYLRRINGRLYLENRQQETKK